MCSWRRARGQGLCSGRLVFSKDRSRTLLVFSTTLVLLNLLRVRCVPHPRARAAASCLTLPHPATLGRTLAHPAAPCRTAARVRASSYSHDVSRFALLSPARRAPLLVVLICDLPLCLALRMCSFLTDSRSPCRHQVRNPRHFWPRIKRLRARLRKNRAHLRTSRARLRTTAARSREARCARRVMRRCDFV